MLSTRVRSWGVALVAPLLVGVGAFATSVPAQASLPDPVPTYRVIDLGKPLTGYSVASHINEKGQITGNNYPESGYTNGFIWSPEAPTRQSLGIYNIAGGINESGDVAVLRQLSPNSAARWDAASKKLVPLPAIVGNSAALDLNDAGLVVGYSDVPSAYHAVQWDGGVVDDLGTLDGYPYSSAHAVNNSGQSAGDAINPGPAWRHDPGVDELVDLGTLGGDRAYAYDISDAGEVVGISTTAESTPSNLRYRGFVTAPNSSTMTAIDTLGGTNSYAYGINAHGVVVGTADTAVAGVSRAYFRTTDGVLHELPGAVAGQNSSAGDINDRGWIVGIIGDHAVLWVPTTFPDVPITHPFFDAIAWMVGTHLTGGYADGNFHPTDPVTRQAVAAFLYRLSGSPNGEHPLCDQAPFDDVPADHPLCGEIAWLVHEGLATGYAGNVFKPGAPVSRQALAAFLYRLAGNPNGATPTCDAMPFDDVPTGSLFCGHISWLAAEGVVAGYPDGGFHPTATITRQAVASFLFKYDQR